MAEAIDYKNLPKHIAIVMDGNGRWAKRFFLNSQAGHKAGAQTLQKLTEQMNALGFPLVTVFAFSTENWKRSEEEVSNLMHLLRDYLKQYQKDSKKNNMRITTIGDLSKLDQDIQTQIANLTEQTKQNTGLCVNIAINYGGRDDIVRAAKKAIALGLTELDEQKFTTLLDTHDLPDPDLLIRTSGEMRLSNFLLWQSAYTELYVCEKLWPDFTLNDLLEAVTIFQKRERRFGGRYTV